MNEIQSSNSARSSGYPMSYQDPFHTQGRLPGRDSSQLISDLLCGLYLVTFRSAESHPKWTGLAMLPRHSTPRLLMRIFYSANEHSKLSPSTQLWSWEFGSAAQIAKWHIFIRHSLAGLKVSGCSSGWDPLKKWGNLILSATHFL